MHFNKRVQEFIKTIIMNKAGSNKMPVKYYNYRVEFQLRGAGHIHGTLWLDLEKLSRVMDTSNPEGREAMDETVEDTEEGERDPKHFERVFESVKEENIGLYHTDCGGECSSCKDLESLAWLADRFMTCTLKNPSTRDLALSLQQHKHFPKSCKKRGTDCRYGAPWFPCLRTIIQVPARVKFKQETVTEEEKVRLIEKAKQVQGDVTAVLQDKELMMGYELMGDDDIETYLFHRRMEQNIGRALKERKSKHEDDPAKSCDPEVLQDYQDHIDSSIAFYAEMEEAGLIERQKYHILEKEKIDMQQIKRDRLKLILDEAKIEGETFEEKNKNYEDALSYSFKKGYKVNVKRDIDEIYTNTYNPVWIQAWDANIDIQICLDFFAVITYITDYYMKDDSGLMKEMQEALDKDEGGDLKSKLNLVKNVFLTHRQVGESELYYKMFPSLHLVHSNIGTQFCPTGFKQNRSRFMKEVDPAGGYNIEKLEKIAGREGKLYLEKSGYLEKYERLPVVLKDKLSYSQFMKRYDPARSMPESYSFEDDLKENVTHQMIEDGDYIYCDPEEVAEFIKLPNHIPLGDTDNPEGFTFMKRRRPRVIRIHKVKQITQPHEYYYSEMQLFLPFDKEDDLFPDDADACERKYNQNIEKIDFIRSKVMPFAKKVEAAREMAEAVVDDIAEDYDPENEVEKDKSALEGARPHPDYDVKNPEGMYNDPKEFIAKDSFRKIELDGDDELCRKIRSLDPEQRSAFDLIVQYARDSVKAKKGKNSFPVAPNLLVLGGAGTGKSHLIDVLSQYTEKTFRTPGDAPNQPYVLRLAFTGSAAKLIKGQTIHSVFKFAFNNEIRSAPQQSRDQMRSDLQNLRIIIIDEISLVQAEMLYQIHFRLSTEIFQNGLLFGGVAVVVLGDIMQIRPVKGTHVFGKIKNNQELRLEQSRHNLWHKFSVIVLKTNHRQGEDKGYADILNRLRVGTYAAEDNELLKKRVRPYNDSIPENALIVAGSNEDVNNYNTCRLNKIVGDLIQCKAVVFSESRGVFKPKLNNDGSIIGTTLQYHIDLKKGCRVMLTTNLDLCDGLVNGSLGTVVGFEYNRARLVQHIMVKFDDNEDGVRRRKNFDSLVSKYPGENATPIEKMEYGFSQSKKQDVASARATAVNFPLKLCYATTAHKIQGSTVKKPTSIVLHLHGYLVAAMGYVMLSRIQCIDQLIIVRPPKTQPEFKIEDIKPYDSAMTELGRLQELDITKQPKDYTMSVISLNIRSLRKHFEDVKAHHSLVANNVICLQETWLEKGIENCHNFSLPNKSSTFASGGPGKGVAIFFSDQFQPIATIVEEHYTLAAVRSEKMVIVNIYRSNDTQDHGLNARLVQLLDENIHQEAILVVGDLNFCERSNSSHTVRQALLGENFQSLLDPPFASHMDGRCLDQAYLRREETSNLNLCAHVGTCSYSDHDPVIVEVFET